MAARPRVLLVLFEGLPATVVDSTVLGHARDAAWAGVAECEVWAFCCSGPIYRAAQARRAEAERSAGCPVRVLRGLRPAIPGSVWLNRLIVLFHLVRRRPLCDVLHARTDYAAAVCGIVNRVPGALLVWDCRGDMVAEQVERLTARGTPGALVRMIRWRAERIRKSAGALCDRAIYVSAPLARLCALDRAGKPCEIIPTAASDTLFSHHPALRDETRRSLALDARHRVLVYSGSLAEYQCFDEVASLFAELLAVDPDWRLLVLTPEIEKASAQLADIPPAAVKVIRSGHGAMNAYLNAADVATMLRRPSALNHVAMPTKFAEYCLTGLPVVMTDAVEDAAAIAARLGNRAAVQDGRLVLPPAYDRARTASEARALLGRDAMMERFRRIYAPNYASAASQEPSGP